MKKTRSVANLVEYSLVLSGIMLLVALCAAAGALAATPDPGGKPPASLAGLIEKGKHSVVNISSSQASCY